MRHPLGVLAPPTNQRLSILRAKAQVQRNLRVNYSPRARNSGRRTKGLVAGPPQTLRPPLARSLILALLPFPLRASSPSSLITRLFASLCRPRECPRSLLFGTFTHLVSHLNSLSLAPCFGPQIGASSFTYPLLLRTELRSRSDRVRFVSSPLSFTYYLLGLP